MDRDKKLQQHSQKSRKEKKPPRVYKNGWHKFWHEWILPFAIVAVVFSTFRSVVVDWNDVPTGSMEPTIMPGDRIFVNKLAFGVRVPFTKKWIGRWNSPKPGNVVICFSPKDGTRLVKRVIAGPGDVVQLIGNKLTINDQPLEYGDLDAFFSKQINANERANHRFTSEHLGEIEHPVMLTPMAPSPRNFGPVTVPGGEYIVMGDNRDRSADSRSFGFMPRDEILGRSSLVLLSVDKERKFMPRWGRFFRKIP